MSYFLKTIIWLLPFICSKVAAQVVAEKSRSFLFTGTVGNTHLTWLYLTYIDAESRFIEDSCKLVNGRFRFSGNINEPVQASLYLQGAQNTGSTSFTYFFLEPGKLQGNFSVGKFKTAEIIGSQSQLVYESFVKKAGAFPLYIEKSEAIKTFVQQHPQSYVSAHLLQTQLYRMPLDTLQSYFNLLSVAVQKSTDGHLIADHLTKGNRIAPGRPAPAFLEKDVNGETVTLEKFRGKYVLLDFWASWCIPCRQQSSYLRKASALFSKKGLVIIGLSQDEDTAAWKRAMVKDSLNWTQILLSDVWNNKTAKAYNITGKGIPYNYLISPEGIILATDLRSDELLKKLQQYLN